MQITKTDGARFELAVDRFREGHPISFKNLSLRLTRTDEIECSIAATWQPESINEARAQADFEAASATLDRLLQAAPLLAGVIEDRQVRYQLIHDYGTGGILVARLLDGRIAWAAGFPVAGYPFKP